MNDDGAGLRDIDDTEDDTDQTHLSPELADMYLDDTECLPMPLHHLLQGHP